MKEVRIRDISLPEIDSYSIVEVTVHDEGLSIFSYDQYREGDTSSGYLTLAKDEATKLRDILVKELK